jgi:2-polyprenyl-3-methyl-5-hydroxy-6-metoxy-1,4-benzoquinol methylase
MTKAVRSDTPSDLSGDFLKEYSTGESIRRYSKETAGHGISYLLDHDYGKIYLDVIEKYVPKPRLKKGIRLWEFGCGGGMNLLHLVSLIERRGIPLDCAYGTDFSETLIETAKHEATNYLRSKHSDKIRFCVAKNENLIEDVTKGVGISKGALLGSFDVILGVNTIRYCHRLANEDKCVEGLFDLLTDGGVCIIIDMNQNFPVFRSRFRDRLTKDQGAYYLPSLDEHTRPFSSAGFEILKKENFCWIPHSAGRGLTAVMKALTPTLNALVPNRAMRSLVISRKPVHRAA